jgi:hypothetical protein
VCILQLLICEGTGFPKPQPFLSRVSFPSSSMFLEIEEKFFAWVTVPKPEEAEQ